MHIYVYMLVSEGNGLSLYRLKFMYIFINEFNDQTYKVP